MLGLPHRTGMAKKIVYVRADGAARTHLRAAELSAPQILLDPLDRGDIDGVARENFVDNSEF